MKTLNIFLLILLLTSCAPENTDEVVRGKETKPLDNPLSLYCKSDRFVNKNGKTIPEGDYDFFLDFYIEGIINNRNYRLRQIWGTYSVVRKLIYYVDLKNIYITHPGGVSFLVSDRPWYIINRETLIVYDQWDDLLKTPSEDDPYRHLAPIYKSIKGHHYTIYGNCKIFEKGLAYRKYKNIQKKLKNAEENRLKDYQEELKKQREKNKI